MDPGNAVVKRRKPQKDNQEVNQNNQSSSNQSDDKHYLKSENFESKLSWEEWTELNCGFHPRELMSLDRLTALFYRPCDATSLSAVRLLFGIVMLIDTVEERGFTEAERLWGDPKECRFPLFYFLRPLPLKWMYFLYTIMSLGAIGISLGAYYRFSCLALTLPYWYILLLNKSVWNNHSYLYGLLCILMTCSSASNVWSFDRIVRRKKYDDTVPLWNYSILRFQLFALYFFAGLKKINRDWLSGYSMMDLSTHWVFSPFTTIFLLNKSNESQLAYKKSKKIYKDELNKAKLNHNAGYIEKSDNKSKAAWTLVNKVRNGGFKSQSIEIPPEEFNNYYLSSVQDARDSIERPQLTAKDFMEQNDKDMKKIEVSDKRMEIGLRKKIISLALIFYMGLQCFMPYSHFVTKGYNNWTNGLYGYSWDMMVHTWIRHRIVVKVVDRSFGHEYFLNPEAWVKTDRWTTHADMLLQYAQCIESNIQSEHPDMKNVSVYVDVWYSLNGRFQQRMFDPRVDLLRAPWSPFKKVEFLLPLLSDLSHWRRKIMDIREEIWKWSNRSDALFVADFPGLSMESYMNGELRNVSLTALEGIIVLERNLTNKTMMPGDNEVIPTNTYHKVYTVSEVPSCFVYSFINETDSKVASRVPSENSKPFTEIMSTDVRRRLSNFRKAFWLVAKTLVGVLFFPLSNEL
ncbi:vitamin K-dependent gamma-carboxylase [Nilaparvata lugens]|uniref:vitamin K-dependent gamma-carboxylase n=1 Tax=Nilaparvata lugens TaxID=108931 RepID=UPI00193D1F36|nr:vitamin K-dependent gamma-carboxylase [Nilaparvata lugens]